MFEYITKEYIKEHQFLRDGLHFENKKADVDYKFAPGAHIPEHPDKMMIELRKRFVDLIVVRFDNNYSRIEADTGVNRSTIRKFLQNNRGLTRDALAKLCVGLKVSMEEVQEYFRLHGHVLNPEDNLLDAIVVNCIECGSDIYEFKDMCEEYELDIKW